MIETKKETNPMNFTMRVELLRISQTFVNLRRLYTEYDYSFEEQNIVRFLLISDEFREKIRNTARHISFGSEECEVANMILQRRVFEDSTVIFSEDLPNASIWNIVGDFLCVEAINPNGKTEASSPDYIQYPGIKSHMSSGYGSIYCTFYDIGHEMIEQIAGNPEVFNVRHDCDDNVIRIFEWSLQEFMDKTDRRHLIHISIEDGKKFVCPRCGETIFFSAVNPETLFNFSRDRLVK